MKVKSVLAENFGSYELLQMDLADKGLTLVHGATGSGKSTLPDVVAWTLFGVTAKGGAADDVRAWGSPNPTSGQVFLEGLTVVRKRGKANQNDLFFYTDDSGPIRGKDATDTQKLLNERLGCDADTFLSASYLSEFSPTATFFSARAKDRREVFERVADLSLPVTLLERIKTKAKLEKTSHDSLLRTETQRISQRQVHVSHLQRLRREADAWEGKQRAALRHAPDITAMSESLGRQAAEWYDQHARRLEALADRIDQVTQKQASVEDLQKSIKQLQAGLERLRNTTCGECGGPKEGAKADKQVQLIQAQKDALQAALLNQARLDGYIRELDTLDAAVNPFNAQIDACEQVYEKEQQAYEALKAAVNPHKASIAELEEDTAKLETGLAATSEARLAGAARISALDQLADLTYTLRATLLLHSVTQAEEKTNNILERHFESEIRVKFEMADADSLNVSIIKNGHQANFKQLSKGQRQLLKLSFMVGVMDLTANNAGQSFNVVFADEALDGLDSELKVKALTLFEEMAVTHGSVYLIEHSSEVKALVDNRIEVTLNGDHSELRFE